MSQVTAANATTATAPQPKAWGGGRSPFNVSYGKMMMWFFLISDAFTFGAFLIAYGTKRFFSAVWPDPNHVFHSFPFLGEANLPLLFVSLMTFILIVSSVTMVMAVHAGHYGDREGVIKWMIWTIIGGIAFLGCQAWEWTHLGMQNGGLLGVFQDPNTPMSAIEHFFSPKVDIAAQPAAALQATDNFYNFFFAITGFHGFHVLSGVVFLIIILINTVNGTYHDRGHYEMVEKVGLYWHFVDLVWVFVFTCFYLL
jgi:cytochrome c oxidase subunit 3